MTFAELVDELKDRGFSDLTDVRAKRFINQARAELDLRYLWPYREASVTGDAPIVITDLGAIEAVVNVSNSHSELRPIEFREIVRNGDITMEGTPEFYYVGHPAGLPTVAVYPESSDTIGVQYYRVTDELVDDADEPAAPKSFHGLIVDMAVRRAYRDRDNMAEAAALGDTIEADLATMFTSLMTQQIQGPTFIQVSPTDY